MKIRLNQIVFTLAILGMVNLAAGQTVVKYGSDFMGRGVGARALGMGATGIASANDVSAGYWNPAGLTSLTHPQIAYMHEERFAGVVQFDYAAFGKKISDKSYASLHLIRSGVDDIPETWDAWDEVRGLPKPNPENFIRYFSAVDYAFVLSYGRRINENLSLGASGKIVRRSIGDYASAWGYSMDIGARYSAGGFEFGAVLQDATTMLQSWSVSDSTKAAIGSVGGVELTLPVLRLGSTWQRNFTEKLNFLAALEFDVAFDNQQAFSANIGAVSFHPRLGTELIYADLVALRMGVSDVSYNEDFGLEITPTVGIGIFISDIQIDYAFGNLVGVADDLGFNHRISIMLSLTRSGRK